MSSKRKFQKILRPGLRRGGAKGERLLMPYPPKPGKALSFLPEGGAEVVATSGAERVYWQAAIAAGDVEVLDSLGSAPKKAKEKKAKPEPAGKNRPDLAEGK